MMKVLLVCLFLMVVLADEWAIELHDDMTADQFAKESGMKLIRPLVHIGPNFYLFEGSHKRAVPTMAKRAERQIPIQRYTRTDPLLTHQWNLRSDFLNVTDGVWNEATGNGVVVGIVDDGGEWEHPDLIDRVDRSLCWDFNNNHQDPTPKMGNSHGTACGGMCCMSANNVCGRGIAYNAKLAFIKLLEAPINDATESSALSHKANEIDIYSCSWGPADYGNALSGPGWLTSHAIDVNTEVGKIYVWAAGNGRGNGDSCSYDGFAQHRHTITVGALAENKKAAPYSEACAALFCVTPSSGPSNTGTWNGVISTDLQGWYGHDSGDCTSGFGGTSAAAPSAAGVIALLKEVNPSLVFRDVQHILAESSRPVDSERRDWTPSEKYSHSHLYGFGLLQPWKAIELAKTWKEIPFENQARVNSVDTFLHVTNPGFDFTETVEILVRLSGAIRHGTVIILESPMGTNSTLASPHPDYGKGYQSWTFTTVRHWGEDPTGTWSLHMSASGTYTYNGALMVVYGHTKEE